jgi:Fic family protein
MYNIYIIYEHTIHVEKDKSNEKGCLMEIFKIEKPPMTDLSNLLDIIRSEKDILTYIEKINKPEYLYWDKAKYKPHPKGITSEYLWSLVKFLRKNSPSRAKTIIMDEKGNYFTWQALPELDYFLHEVDLQLGGLIESTIWDGHMARQRFIIRGIMEEAIASSQLEGANTTRKAAKQMLLEKRKPSNRSEQMILNNYQAMLEIEQTLSQQDLSRAAIIDLHTTLLKNTVVDEDIGRFRTDKDEIVVAGSTSEVIYHVAPSEKFMRAEFDRLIDFANDNSTKHPFVHPLIKAIMLHFWIGYLHPFADGNGRLARTIFYWYLLRNKYWAFSYLPVSRAIRSSPALYRDAYLYSEQDENDLTYFIDYNIRKIRQAKLEFENYLKRKVKENLKMTGISRSKYGLNDRQIQLLRYLFKNANATTTIKTHSLIYEITRITARKDLENLEKANFLSSKKIGRDRLFEGTSKIADLFS